MGIQGEDLNDNKIVRVMDKLYRYVLTILFLIMALKLVEKYGVGTKYSHLDSPSLQLYGEYNNYLNNLGQELLNISEPVRWVGSPTC